MATVLLEIGTEELPARDIPQALRQMDSVARERFAAERVAIDNLQAWGTPRRLALVCTGVAERQSPTMRQVRGPAVSAAFAANGDPTQAALGFARSQNVPVTALRIIRADDVEYLAAQFPDDGHPTLERLPALLRAIVDGVRFPRTMRWSASGVRFARPVRWLVALMDGDIVPFTLDGLTTGRHTRGHRFLAAGQLTLPAAGAYGALMEENHVLVDPHARREEIRRQLAIAAQQDGGVILDDGVLLEDTTFHVEYPTVVRGTFDERFLELPRAVVLHVLRDEQHFFPLEDARGRLMPAFLAVRNGDKAYLGTVREGYERVARAKLIDALFFFDQDRRMALADRLEMLREVTVFDGSSTLHDKAMRMQRLAGRLATRMGLSDNARAHAMRAALLAKADLVTATVVEHPILHGFMGGVYAELSGEPDPVVAAIAAHECAPPADELPADPVTRVVALADKLDALVACFAANLIPTPAADPYALHDAAVIVGRLLDEGGGEDILECVIADAADGMIDNPDDLVTRVAGFVRRAYGHHKPEHDSPHG